MIFVVGALMVIASQIPLVCHWAMVPDTVDYGEWKSGKRGEGVTYGLVTFSQKLGSAIGAAITGLILSLSGYVPNVVQTEKALTGIMHLMVTLPLICYVICLALYYFYKLDRKTFDKILQEISDRQVAG
jgi:Na+/melibiose symporter-like transporter